MATSRNSAEIAVDPLRWKRISELFAEARLLDGERRLAFLKERCGEDQDVLQELKFALALFRLEALFSLRRAMADLTRKPPESVQVVGPSGELPVPTDLANERHYSIIEISKLWGLSEKTVRRIFEGEQGVIHWGSGERLHKRGYHTLRVPETVLHQVHRKLRKAS